MSTKPAGPTDWETEPLPAERTTVLLDRLFSPDEMHLIRAGFIPQWMEDRWFVYWQDDALHFHRSWTGYCIYIVRFVREGEAWRMVRADGAHEEHQPMVRRPHSTDLRLESFDDALVRHASTSIRRALILQCSPIGPRLR